MLNKSFPQNYCGLTRVGGKFNGSTNDVRASVWLSAQGWLVDASGTEGPVTVGARCITQTALP